MIEKYNKQRCLLGEGLYIFDGIPHWVDILDRKIYIGEEETIKVDFIPSSVLFANKDFLILAGDQGIIKLDGKGNIISTKEISGHNPETHRMNDAVFFDEDFLIIGSMSKENPETIPGYIYTISKGKIKKLEKEIFIPNSFIKIDENVLITDSKTKEVFRLDLSREKFDLWTKFNGIGTPDGGCLNERSNPIFAIWDGSCLQEYNRSGEKLNSVKLPVKRPTNCKYSKQHNCFFVTSASDGLSPATKSDLNGYLLKITL